MLCFLGGSENGVPSWIDDGTEGREESYRIMFYADTCLAQESMSVITNGEEQMWGHSTIGRIQHTEMAAAKETALFWPEVVSL